MLNKRKRQLSLFLVFILVLLSSSHRVEAFSLSLNPFSIFSNSADKLTRRASDIVHYLVQQKRYIFDDFTDPNTYVSLEIPSRLDKTLDDLDSISLATTSNNSVENSLSIPRVVFTGKPVVVNSPVIPAPKSIVIAPPVNTQTAPVVPVLISNANSPADTTASVPIISKIEPDIKVENTFSDILKYTNDERSSESLPPLIGNPLLDKIAGLRVDDLFNNQYFEHESPDGKSAPDLAKREGYEYLLIGENLALGNFGDDRGIVSAWMDSPGHRANILNGKYRELGVAQRVDNFDGRNVTIAVQVFGQPASSCTKPNIGNKKLIDSSTISIKELQSQAKIMYAELEVMKGNPDIDQSYYNQKIQEYNYFAQKINNAVIDLKNTVDQYNIQVSQYNTCIKS